MASEVDIKQLLERATARPWPKQMNTHCYRDGIERTKEQFDADYELMHAAVNSFESNRELIAEMKEVLSRVSRDAHEPDKWRMEVEAALAKVREAGL